MLVGWLPCLIFSCFTLSSNAIIVDEKGVSFFTWHAPGEKGRVINENVPLLGFDEITSRLEQQMKNVSLKYDDGITEQFRVYITDIKLGYMRIKEKDSKGGYLMVPAWDFYGYAITKYTEKEAIDTNYHDLDENRELKSESFAQSFLTINAVDGSIIDRYSEH